MKCASSYFGRRGDVFDGAEYWMLDNLATGGYGETSSFSSQLFSCTFDDVLPLFCATFRLLFIPCGRFEELVASFSKAPGLLFNLGLII